MVAVDASTVCGPGATGPDARIHAVLRLADLSWEQVQVTDHHGGETFKRFVWHEGQLVFGDRGYCNAPGVAHVLDCVASMMGCSGRTKGMNDERRTQLEASNSNANARHGTPTRFKGDDIAERLLDLAAGVVRLLPSLGKQPGAASLVKQLERCAPAGGANYEPNCTSLDEYSEVQEHARLRRARALKRREVPRVPPTSSARCGSP